MQLSPTASSLDLSHKNISAPEVSSNDSAADTNADAKRKYLGLLPPLQLIELCLAFELHVPLDVKKALWPLNFDAAITALQSVATPQTTHGDRSTLPPNIDPSLRSDSLPTSERPFEMPPPPPPPKSDAPVMDSLMSPPEPLPPSAPPSVPPPEPSTSSTPGGDQPSNPAYLHSQVQPPTTYQPTAYPHQPYGFSHTQPAYPHAPYYPPYPYPYPPGAYPPGYPHASPPNPLFTHAPLPGSASSSSAGHYPTASHYPPLPASYAQQMQNAQPAEDLPSYEEMIVEALADTDDPDGCPPKNLFAWMAAHYPLQTNFRPSASQALQKAFKRGRLEKSPGGKYRLNKGWEGGNTSRRTTRRPQTQTQTQGGPTGLSNSPFTHAPLPPVPRGTQTYPASASTNSTNPPTTNYPHTFPPPPHFGYPVHPPVPQSLPSDPGGGTGGAGLEAEDAGDVWEAAQSILKAINFKGLLALPREEDGGVQGGDVELPTTDACNGVAEADNTKEGLDEQGRAALQAQLALLAALLHEIAEGGEGEKEGGIVAEEGDDEDDDDMEEVFVGGEV